MENSIKSLMSERLGFQKQRKGNRVFEWAGANEAEQCVWIV